MFLTFFFFNATATTEIYTLSLHDALPICDARAQLAGAVRAIFRRGGGRLRALRSEEHTSELQSQSNLVCRLLLEKKKKQIKTQRSLKAEWLILLLLLRDRPMVLGRVDYLY